MPDETAKNPTPGAERRVDDKELLQRYLKKIGCEASYEKLAAQGITEMAQYQQFAADEKLKDALSAELEKEGGSLIDKRLATVIRKTDEKEIGETLKSVDQTVPAVPKKIVRPSANEGLKSYLSENGFGSELLPVFESRGITSVGALDRVLLKPDGAAYKDLQKALNGGTEVDDVIYSGSPELAETFRELSKKTQLRQEVPQAARPDFRKTGLDSAAQNRYAQLKQAVEEVNALRQKDADAAKELGAEISKETKARLESILSRANSRELLDIFAKNSQITVKDLNTALDAVSERLIAGSESAFNSLIYEGKVGLMSADELAAANCLQRGMLITATGMYECSGSDLVTCTCGVGTPGPYEEVICDYQSEQNYQFAEKTIKESSHTYSTSNSLLGGFFSSSGIGAISGAFQYAQSTMSSMAKSHGESTGKATKVKERSIYAPKAVLTMPRERLQLSSVAVRYLKLIAAESDSSRKREYAQQFLANFGGHVFRSVTLGGRYSYVARAESTSRDTYDGLDTALSEAQKKAGSFAGGFFGSFLGGASTAHQDETTSASATSITTIAGQKKQTVRVSISVRGGLQEMPLDQWKQSLLLDKWWRVIDRREAIAVWDLLRVATIDEMQKETREKLAALLECVWVQDIFIASLAESEMAGYQKFAEILKEKSVPDTVQKLEDKMRDEARRMAPPMMTLRYFTVTTKERSRGGEVVVMLPESYKILSGGGGATTNVHQVLIASYPIKRQGENSKELWGWCLKTKAAFCADGRDKCSNEETAMDSLTVGLIALYDPNDEWDVRVVERRFSNRENAHVGQVTMDQGYEISGCGVRIESYDVPAITGAGFSMEAADQAAEGIALRACDVKTGNMSAHGDDHNGDTHTMTAYGIGIRAANGAVLQPVYSVEKSSKEEQHLNHNLLHKHTPESSMMIGGGVWITGERNFLSGSMPELDLRGNGRWKAYSADRAGKVSPQKMQLVTIGLKNVRTKLEGVVNFSDRQAKYEFKDVFKEWAG